MPSDLGRSQGVFGWSARNPPRVRHWRAAGEFDMADSQAHIYDTLIAIPSESHAN